MNTEKQVSENIARIKSEINGRARLLAATKTVPAEMINFAISEGIDLKGERLIGAIIVGVGLPTISSELNIIKEHFDNTRENGYAYTYTYPGMIKVTQAAGRVIRSDDERGVVLLVDDRFATPEYREIMPSYWSHMKFLNNAKDLLAEIVGFWKK